MARSPDDSERRALLSPPANNPEAGPHDDVNKPKATKLTFALGKFVLALIGVFIANVDTSIVVATFPSIASGFQDLGNGEWLMTIYTLGFSAALPAYGATSDSFGRKAPLLAAYCLFMVGCLVSGVATSLPQVILGRMIAGIGGAGMTTMVSIIMTDFYPLSKVAILRGYVNVAAVAGRSAGGPIGGLLYDSIGWRWSFLLQVPIVFGCLVIAMMQHLPKIEFARKKRRLDLLGLLTFALAIASLLVFVSYAGKNIRDPRAYVFAATFVAFSVVFLLVESFWASNPVLSPPLVWRQGTGSYLLVQTLLFIAMFSLVANLATFFARTEWASNSIIALHIVPTPVGNAVGSLLASKVVSRTQKYKLFSVIAAVFGVFSFVVIMLRWRGRITVWESLEVFPPSFVNGALVISLFIGLTAAVDQDHSATMISFFFLSQQIGMMIGTSASSAISRQGFRSALDQRLEGIPGKAEIIREVLSDTRASKNLPAYLQPLVLSSYVHGFSLTTMLSIGCSVLVLPLLLLLPEQHID